MLSPLGHPRVGRARVLSSLRNTVFAFIVGAALALGVMSAPAQAAEPDTRGLFGSQDPTYDGVYRQSAAILGLLAIRARVPKPAVGWLLRQQCADGSFSAFRADTAQPCPAPDAVNFTGPDTNSTAMAIMALRTLATREEKGRGPLTQAVAKATAWLVAQQGADGSWVWIRGLEPDSTSTSMALSAIGRPGSPRYVRATNWLTQQMSLESGCGLSFQPGGPADPLSTSWALIGVEGSLPLPRQRAPRTLAPCSGTAIQVVASGSWLAATLIAGDGRIPSAFDPAATDWNSTALATLGMSQKHGSTQAMRLGLAALKENVDEYAGPAATGIPAALGTLLMLSHTTNSNAQDFGGADLTERLLLTLRK